jgi:hypothetical protein
MSQSGWRHCGKCQGLFFGDNPTSVCPAGGAHAIADDPVQYNFMLWLFLDPPDIPQINWNLCNKCQGLFYSGQSQGTWFNFGLDWNASTGVCPAGGGHAYAGSAGYVVEFDPSIFASSQAGWAHCNKCEGLFYANNLLLTSGTCPAGGGHNLAGSSNYAVGIA